MLQDTDWLLTWETQNLLVVFVVIVVWAGNWNNKNNNKQVVIQTNEQKSHIQIVII